MKITLELYGNVYTIEAPKEDYLGDELVGLFSRLLVTAGFSPSIIPTPNGEYLFVGEDEKVVKKGGQ